MVFLLMDSKYKHEETNEQNNKKKLLFAFL